MKKLALALLIGGALFLGGCSSERMVTVGDIRYSHSTYTEEVYIVVRENGDEAYLLDRYVEECLQTYKERGTYGTKVPQGKTL